MCVNVVVSAALEAKIPSQPLYTLVELSGDTGESPDTEDIQNAFSDDLSVLPELFSFPTRIVHPRVPCQL